MSSQSTHDTRPHHRGEWDWTQTQKQEKNSLFFSQKETRRQIWAGQFDIDAGHNSRTFQYRVLGEAADNRVMEIRNLMTSLYSLEKGNLEGMEVSVSLWGSASGSPGKGIQRVEWGSQRVHGAAGGQGQEPGKLQVARQSWELYSRSNLLRQRKPDVFYSKTSWYTSGFFACLFVWSLGRRELFTQTAFISGVCK